MRATDVHRRGCAFPGLFTSRLTLCPPDDLQHYTTRPLFSSFRAAAIVAMADCQASSCSSSVGLLGGGEVAEAGFDGGDGGFETGDLFFGVAEAVFELFEFDGVQALDGCGGSGFGGW